MKIVYGCYPSVFSLLILNLLLQKHKLNIKTVLLSTKPISLDGIVINDFKSYIYAFNRLGVRFVIYQTFVLSVMLFFIKLKNSFSVNKKILSFEGLCKKYQINLIKSSDFNNLEIVKQIDHNDIFISMCLDQIISDKFINSFNGNCYNVHPSDLPQFRGVDSIFQFLVSDLPLMGITLHSMTSKIDDGRMYIKNYVERKDSHLYLMQQFIIIGCDMVSQFIANYDYYKHNEIKELEPILYPYRSWPTKQEIKMFYQNHSFWCLSDFFDFNLYKKNTSSTM